MIHHDQTHIFAIYSKSIDSIIKNNNLSEVKSLQEISEDLDNELLYRISVILRLGIGDKFIIFNNSYHLETLILKISKKSIVIEVLSINKNKQINPTITWTLPILKRAAFEEAIYNLGQLGVQFIQLLNTEKSQKWFSQNPKELIRIEKILIASAEQSKNYNIPKVIAPVNFNQFILDVDCSIINQSKIFFDIDTELNCKNLVKDLDNKSNITVISGPEADLSLREKDLLRASGFNFYKLTPTVLKAEEAVTIGAGILRSFL